MKVPENDLLFARINNNALCLEALAMCKLDTNLMKFTEYGNKHLWRNYCKSHIYNEIRTIKI